MNGNQGGRVSADLTINLLGSLRVQAHGSPLALPKSRKARAILGYLAVQNRAMSRDALCEVFFDDVGDPRGGLRWCMSRLRQGLNGSGFDLLVPGSERIELRPGAFSTDVERLQQALAVGAPLETLLEIEETIDGGFLDDLALDSHASFASWRLAQRARCRDLHIRLLEHILATLEQDGTRIEHARRLTELDPGNETAWALLVSALLEAGERPEARQVLQLAQEQLDRAGTAAEGKLVDAARQLRVRATRDSMVGHGKPILAVLPSEGGTHAELAGLRRDCHHALFAAASAVKAVVLSSQSLMLSEDDAGSALAAAQRAGAELLIESQLQDAGGTSLGLAVQLTHARTRALLCSWQVELPGKAAEARERILKQLGCRFELDFPIVLVGVAREKPPERLSGWDLYHLALPKIYTAEGYSAEDALALLDKALEVDPNIGPALCASAWVRSTHAEHNTSREDRRAAATLARRAVELCQDDAFVMGWAAICIAALDQDIDTARDIARRALVFNPYSSMALIANGVVDHYGGDDEAALAWIEQAETGGDTEPLTFLSYAIRSMANFQLGDFDAAIDWGRRSVGRNPRFVLPLRSLTAALAASGRLSEAAASGRELVAADPSEHLSFFRERSPYVDPEATARLCEALALAGLPENRRA